MWCWAVWMSVHSLPTLPLNRATGISLGSWILVGNFYSKFWAVEGHFGCSVGLNSIKRRGSLCPEFPILSSSLLPLEFYLAALYCFSTQSLALMSAKLEFFFSLTHLIFETFYCYFCDLSGCFPFQEHSLQDTLDIERNNPNTVLEDVFLHPDSVCF